MFLYKKIEKALGMRVLVSDEMSAKIRLWRDVYTGRAPWLDENVKSMNLCCAIACELARLTTLEFKSRVSGSERAELIDKSYQNMLVNLRQNVEYACGIGGVVLKPFVEDGNLEIEYVSQDRFFPTKVNTRGEIVSAAFCEYRKVGEKQYVRIEHHEMTNEGVTITNRAFLCGGLFTSYSEVPLSKVSEWSELSEYVFFEGVKKPLFAYFKIPFANNFDLSSPLGVSVFSRALDVICEADKQYSRLLWEFEGGELAIDASVDAIRQRGKDFVMPHLKERLFRGLDIESEGGDLYSVFAPELRDSSIINGLNQLFMRIEDLCGLSRGMLSDLNQNARTATELKMMRQKTHSSVTDIQKALEKCLTELVRALSVLCDIYNLAPMGEVNLIFEFDYSIIADRTVEFKERQTLLENGVILPWEMRAWYLGESEEMAKEVLLSHSQ